ncbi:S-adenosyl-L-methionine-dependent methyltransferase [Chytriomyces sp. MP71]|nr:S-adenosyl-L-methionine-dependent methyltransferase [Chytriomyces sp. MP71]
MATVASKTFIWSPSAYAANAAFVPRLGATIKQALNAQCSERILDLGCGDGVLTREIALASGAVVVGIDGSEAMIKRAIELHLEGEYRVMDGHCLKETTWASLPDDDKFDAVFSNAALHWMKASPSQVVSGIRSILKPHGKGRFVAEFGGFLNVASVHAGLINALNRRGYDGKATTPWYFPSATEYAAILEANGFQDVQVEHVPRPTPLGEPGLKGWLDTFAMPFMDALGSEEERETVKSEIVEELKPVLCDYKGNWTLDYWRLRIHAVTC